MITSELHSTAQQDLRLELSWNLTNITFAEISILSRSWRENIGLIWSDIHVWIMWCFCGYERTQLHLRFGDAIVMYVLALAILDLVGHFQFHHDDCLPKWSDDHCIAQIGAMVWVSEVYCWHVCICWLWRHFSALKSQACCGKWDKPVLLLLSILAWYPFK
jgi:hypothetical protein